MFKLSSVRDALSALGLSVGAISGAHAFAYINTGDISITLNYFDSGTVGYTRNCGGIDASTGALDCDLAAGQGPGSTPGSTSIASLGGAYSDTQGIFRVNTITNTATGASIYDVAFDTYLLTGIFSGLVDIQVNIDANGVVSTRSQGGAISIFENTKNAANNLNNLSLCGPNAAGTNLTNMVYFCDPPGGVPLGTISGGSLFLSANFEESVIVDGSPPNATFQSSWPTQSSGTGSSSGFLNITGGSGASIFALGTMQDTLGNPHDLYFSNSFNLVQRGTTPQSLWNVRDNTGEVVGNQIPEPGSLGLAAVALLAAGTMLRRQRGR